MENQNNNNNNKTEEKLKQPAISTSQSTSKQYIQSQLEIITKIITNAIKQVATKEAKSIVTYVEERIKEMDNNDTETLPIIKNTIRNTLKFLTTDQIKRLIFFIENKSNAEIEKAVYDLLNLNYSILETTYNSFLEFVVNRRHNKSVAHEKVEEMGEETEKSDF
jgi:hypothetical protein